MTRFALSRGPHRCCSLVLERQVLFVQNIHTYGARYIMHTLNQLRAGPRQSICCPSTWSRSKVGVTTSYIIDFMPLNWSHIQLVHLNCGQLRRISTFYQSNHPISLQLLVYSNSPKFQFPLTRVCISDVKEDVGLATLKELRGRFGEEKVHFSTWMWK